MRWVFVLFSFIKMPPMTKLTKTTRNEILVQWNSNIRSQLYFPFLYEEYNETLLCKNDKDDMYMLFGDYVRDDFVVKKIIEKPGNYYPYDEVDINFYLKQYSRNAELDL
jgi:hypothetical protein